MTFEYVFCRIKGEILHENMGLPYSGMAVYDFEHL